jgi:hypothetical protein
MPLLVKFYDRFNLIRFEYSNLLQNRVQNSECKGLKCFFWDQFWEQKEKTLHYCEGF